MSEQVTAHPETITVADLWKQWAYWKLLIDADVCAIGELDSITRLAPRGTSDFLFYANEDTLLKSHYELEIVWHKPSYSDLLDELDTLRTQNRELREALEPFARLAANIGHPHDVFSLPFNNFVTDQDLQNASEALANLRSIGKGAK